MRIACFQGPEKADTPQGNLGRLAHAADEARRRGADLMAAPEMFLTGYALGAEHVRRLAEPVDGPSIGAARQIARGAGIALVFGFPEQDGEAVYNSAIAIGADGAILATYRKTHLFGAVDRAQFSPGQAAPEIFEIGGFRLGLLICYDVEFPENARRLALDGADLMVVPTALMRPFDIVARAVVPVRAFENQVFVAYANRCGAEADFDYCGLSCVIGPDGTDIARAGRGEELIVADLDKAALLGSRQLNPYLTDRRPELYGAVAATMESRT
ncbi:MAG: carbon-nitrogen hydrolase family protein [Rhizobiaceae bacterium]|nr:carbon-nitrogen hydrolase family protein [Rhizobiaceae bacterium]